MTKPNTIKIDDVEYVRSDMVKAPITGSRAVIVVDRGWIFAGDVVRENGRIKITRAIHVFRWESIGFDGIQLQSPAVLVNAQDDARTAAAAPTRPAEIERERVRRRSAPSTNNAPIV